MDFLLFSGLLASLALRTQQEKIISYEAKISLEKLDNLVMRTPT
jgi:hypothetical protein